MLGELIEEAVSDRPGLHVTGRVRTIRDAHAGIPWEHTDLALIDLHLPDGLGMSLAKRVRVSYTRMRVLILSDHRRPSLLTAVEPDELPFWSYALKASLDGRRQLAEVIYQAAHEPYIDPRLNVTASDTEAALASLSDQQRLILSLVAKGLTNASIATRLGVTTKAVEYHLKQIYQALQIAPASEANQRVLAAVVYLQQHAPDTHI